MVSGSRGNGFSLLVIIFNFKMGIKRIASMEPPKTDAWGIYTPLTTLRCSTRKHLVILNGDQMTLDTGPLSNFHITPAEDV
ncbi:hypothetical protein AVEN_122842-1 [Araneus ventricosus]|uniref:Uncharacterized protein n=1 Tax=Araneus ventricosus TaxID=182803 RepID=A0A4Y2VXL4_ARAVE|nr:hypothetical protein AVEN_232676-1 [Araneus ventricosus]GBO28630.1 hypothetical protein AVEN_122842-1 [Araneus ventricosus]